MKTHILESIPENDSDGALTSLLISLADEGFDLIVGASFGYGFAMSRVAELYPTQYFLHISGNHVGPPNYSNGMKSFRSSGFSLLFVFHFLELESPPSSTTTCSSFKPVACPETQWQT